MSADARCIICNNSLQDGVAVLVKKKGLNTLIDKSRQRKDNIWKDLEGLSECVMHRYCRSQYYLGSHVPAKAPSRNKRTSNDKLEINLDLDNCILCNKILDAKHKPVSEISLESTALSIKNYAIERNDDWGRNILQRISEVQSLHNIGAKYHKKCFKAFMYKETGQTGGRPKLNNLQTAFENVCNYIENNFDSQFTLQELLEEMKEYTPAPQKLIEMLEDRYGDELIFFRSQGKPTVICFRDVGHSKLMDSWYSEKAQTEKDERLRIVKMAAAIVREDIRSAKYDTTYYPQSHQFMHNTHSSIPETLCHFLDDVILQGKKGNVDTLTLKRDAIGHAILSATRPNSFISCIQLATGLYIHRKTASRLVLDVLSTLGLCASYNATLLYQASSILDAKTTTNDSGFVQIVANNADHNVCTLDGRGTFHSMGMVSCVTPNSAVFSRGFVKRRKTIPSAHELAKKGAVQIIPYGSYNKNGLESIVFKDVFKHYEPKKIPVSYASFLWAKNLGMADVSAWRGYMECLTDSSENYSVSRVLCMPFINQPPSDMDTINTTLHVALQECRKVGQKTCFVTFDQPLYAKAREIVGVLGEYELRGVVVRLGTFHMLMSYLGAVGSTMGGSGLEDLWKLIYAGVSVEKMLGGHAFSRAVRAHLLTFTALGTIIIDSMKDVTDADREYISQVFKDFSSYPPTLEEVNNDEQLSRMNEKFYNTLEILENYGPTAKLWIQYFKCVIVFMKCIEADRLGNWDLHLEAVREMLPLFHVTGHLPYAKDAHIYLQDMENLENVMDTEEYYKFTREGFFTIRRTDKMWAGIPSDMTIEQVLMRLMKSNGGLTRGRGVTESVLATFILGLPLACDVMEQFEMYCNVRATSSEQHTDLKPARRKRDDTDIAMLIEWFKAHNPFPQTDKIMSISTGLCGNKDINSYNALEIGQACVTAMEGKNAATIKMRNANKVKSLAHAKSTITIDNETFVVNTTLLFQRIIAVSNADDDEESRQKRLCDAFAYELAPYPMTLFDVNGNMRKCKKSDLYGSFRPLANESIPQKDSCQHIVDGGFLLHKVVWHSGLTYRDIFQLYANYIERNYKSDAIVVFDGYSEENASIKSYERSRRFQKNMGAEVEFTEDMIATHKPSTFLSNSKNKSRFIQHLSQYLRNSGIQVKQATEDADRLIVTTAIEESDENETVMVVGNDVDLMVLLIALTPVHKVIYFRKQGRAKDNQFYSTDQHINIKDKILFAHAFTGCDTTNALYGKGKKCVLNMLTKSPSVMRDVIIFNEPNASVNSIENAGIAVMLALYGAPRDEKSLNNYRYNRFKNAVGRATTAVLLEQLPPTASATKEHSKRVYHQVQLWLGNSYPPEEWGWTLKDSFLMPTRTVDVPAPEELLRLISCRCKQNCEKRCGCRKAGLKCTELCYHCHGNMCSNPSTFASVGDDDEYKADTEPVPATLDTQNDDDDDENDDNVLHFIYQNLALEYDSDNDIECTNGDLNTTINADEYPVVEEEEEEVDAEEQSPFFDSPSTGTRKRSRLN